MMARITPCGRPGIKTMTTRARRGGWDVHTHLVPDGLIKAAEIGGRYDLSLKPGQLCMCGRAVPLHPICEAE